MEIENIILYGLATLAGIVILRVLYRGVKGRRMLKQRLTKEYREALKGTDHKKALVAGRSYYEFIRGTGHLSTYDEQVIANDMKGMPQEKIQPPQEDSNDTISKLERLAKLKEQGVLNEVEFLEQKAKILST